MLVVFIDVKDVCLAQQLRRILHCSCLRVTIAHQYTTTFVVTIAFGGY